MAERYNAPGSPYWGMKSFLLLALPDACDTAIQQINDRMYAADFRDDYADILCYGIAFFKKRCMVRKK